MKNYCKLKSSMNKTMRWFENHRQEWIAEILQIFGFINRKHLQRKFSISEPQASIDLQTFQKLNPSIIYYDVSKKCYIVK